MYISALLCAVGTPSEFSSVPILVADELVLPFLVNHDPRVNTLYRTLLSPERLPCNHDLAIRVTTTRNKEGSQDERSATITSGGVETIQRKCSTSTEENKVVWKVRPLQVSLANQEV
jgi:hypothetical protein